MPERRIDLEVAPAIADERARHHAAVDVAEPFEQIAVILVAAEAVADDRTGDEAVALDQLKTHIVEIARVDLVEEARAGAPEIRQNIRKADQLIVAGAFIFRFHDQNAAHREPAHGPFVDRRPAAILIAAAQIGSRRSARKSQDRRANRQRSRKFRKSAHDDSPESPRCVFRLIANYRPCVKNVPTHATFCTAPVALCSQ